MTPFLAVEVSMKIWLSNIRTWATGRKTYLLSALVILVALVLVFFHRLTPETAFTVALVAIGLFAATFRAALQTHHDETLQVLREVAIVGTDVATHNLGAALAVGTQAVQDGAKLDVEIEQEGKQ